ncbi:MAG TPA: AraC family transcriptional regulator [Planctomycetota bacterium]|nr:AraC family transcriptional regulator [Planctomycetota bacterium]
MRPPRDPERHAGLFYITSGEGVWTVGDFKFPCKRGCMFAVPIGIRASAELKQTRPLGYYYCFFETDGTADTALKWPWTMGVPIQEALYVMAEFRPEIAAHFRTIQFELSQHTVLGVSAARAQLQMLGVEFARMLSAGPAHESGGHAATQARTAIPESVARVMDFVHEHLQSDMSLPELAEVARCSERRLADLFRQSLGVSPMAWVREQRIKEAQRLLTQGLPVKEIANRLNFADSHHFSRAFRQSMGISPTEFVAGKAPLKLREEFAKAIHA